MASAERIGNSRLAERRRLRSGRSARGFGRLVLRQRGHRRRRDRPQTLADRLEQDDGGIEGLFGSPIPLPGAPGILIAPTAWWGADDGVIGIGARQRSFRELRGTDERDRDRRRLDANGTKEAIIGTEKGKLIAFDAAGERFELATLAGPIEAAGLLADADRNGKAELFVASNDGLLTCFETASANRLPTCRVFAAKARTTEASSARCGSAGVPGTAEAAARRPPRPEQAPSASTTCAAAPP